MQRFMIVGIAVCCLALPLLTFAADAPQQIVISERGEAKVAPTSGVLNFSQNISVMLVQEDGTTLDADDAKRILVQKAQALTTQVKKGLTFATSFIKDFDANVSISPVYNRDSKQNTVVGFQAYTQYSVTITSLDKADAVTAALVQSGIGQVSSLYPIVDDAGRLDCEKRALRGAVTQAKERADVMAELMGGAVTSLRKAVINPSGTPRIMMAKGMAETTSSMYEPQDSVCGVRVELIFDVQ
ncbi:MAG: SIMPL domain-containing protein [Desulfovibrionales bacterium]|nr:SIMPL domain-containing protein [Desulfovibrionales bacterium]